MSKVINKSAMAAGVLVVSLGAGSTVYANEIEQSEGGNESTYWGLGLGSVLGGVIAGPPGIAIGATLGGALGWGQDQSDALESVKEDMGEKERQLSVSAETLSKQARQLSSQLHSAQAQLGELKRTQRQDLALIEELRAEINQKEAALSNSDLAELLPAYTQDIYFRKSQASFPGYAEDRIGKLADFLNKYPQMQVILTGYTDKSGSAAFNQNLSQARAEGVRAALVDKGVDAQRIKLESQGENVATIDSSDQGNTILDRRVAIALSLPAVLEESAPGSVEGDVTDLAVGNTENGRVHVEYSQTDVTNLADLSTSVEVAQ